MWRGKRSTGIQQTWLLSPTTPKSSLLSWTFLPVYNMGYAQVISMVTKYDLMHAPTLCNPIDGSPPGSPVPGILQARTLEWVAISFPNA